MTFKTHFIQWKSITKGIKLSVTKDPDAEGEVSNFGALTTALAATIGTGNIVGVGTAIALGGPGAVLWCWLSGVFGIATKYAESLKFELGLAQSYYANGRQSSAVSFTTGFKL